jgi:hypothetical protein
MGHVRGAEFLVERDVATARTKGGLYRVGQRIDPSSCFAGMASPLL